MEFIIVFPIYLALFASTLVIGDMLIHSNRLAFGDVVNAFNQDAGNMMDVAWNGFSDLVWPAAEIDENRNSQDSLHRTDDVMKAGSAGRIGYYADENGSWVVCAASRIVNGYRPPAGGALGQLLSAEILLGGSSSQALDDWRSSESRSLMRSKGGNILFESVFGKDNDLKSHSFYVLKRNRSGGHYDEGKWRWMTSELLVNNRWHDKVLDDGWHKDATIKSRYTNDENDVGRRISPYDRYDDFEHWSD